MVDCNNDNLTLRVDFLYGICVICSFFAENKIQSFDDFFLWKERQHLFHLISKTLVLVCEVYLATKKGDFVSIGLSVQPISD